MRNAEFLEGLAGVYELGGSLATIAVRAHELTLSIPGQPVYTLEPVRGTTFRYKELTGYSVEFRVNGRTKSRRRRSTSPTGTSWRSGALAQVVHLSRRNRVVRVGVLARSCVRRRAGERPGDARDHDPVVDRGAARAQREVTVALEVNMGSPAAPPVSNPVALRSAAIVV